MTIKTMGNQVTVTELDRPGFEALKAKANAHGVAITGDTGQAVVQHQTFAWNYEEGLQQLMMTVVHAFWTSPETDAQKLAGALAAA